MTDIRATVVEFDLYPHPNADILSIARIRNTAWQCIVKTAEMQDKTIGLYIPIDSLVSTHNPEFSFLAKDAKEGRARVKTIRLRGALSQGLLIPAPHGSVVGQDFTEALGITRWEPAIPACLRGDMIRDPGNFIKYTSIENYKNFPNVFKEGELVKISEKQHGTNARFGLIDDGTLGELKYYVGTHKTARNKEGTNLYSRMSQTLGLEEKLLPLVDKYKPTQHLIVYGEIYGSGVQDLTYDCEKNQQKLAIFDVLIDHTYQPWEIILEVAEALGVKTVPLLYRGPFDLEKALAFRDGRTILGGRHVREGVVVCAEPEATDVLIGRKMLKFISDDYLLRKNATDGH